MKKKRLRCREITSSKCLEGVLVTLDEMFHVENYSVKNKKMAKSRKNFISANQNDEVQNEARKESRNHGDVASAPRREVLLKE